MSTSVFAVILAVIIVVLTVVIIVLIKYKTRLQAEISGYKATETNTVQKMPSDSVTLDTRQNIAYGTHNPGIQKNIAYSVHNPSINTSSKN